MIEEQLVLKACAVCARMLSKLGDEWIHGLQDQPEDHPAVPVDSSEIEVKGRCDFCNTENPTWVVPALSFDQPLFMGKPTGRSLGPWAACKTCAELVTENRWITLMTRVVRSYRERNEWHPLVGGYLDALYAKLRKHVVGEPYEL